MASDIGCLAIVSAARRPQARRAIAGRRTRAGRRRRRAGRRRGGAICRVRSVTVKCHDIDRSMLEGVLTRGDRRVAAALEEAWRRGARLDAWTEHFEPQLWWKTFEDMGLDASFYRHRERPIEEVLPWDHIHIKYGRDYLVKEQNRSVVQLEAMAGAV